MVERSVVASFTGQLFEAAATTKKWTSISSDSACIQIVNIDEDSHQLVGLDKDSEVLVHDINNEIQLRSKDNFVQWRKKNSAGKQTNYGVRLKNVQESQRLEGIVGGILAMLEIIPSAAPWPTHSQAQTNPKPVTKDRERDVLLKVHLPGKQTTVLSAPPSITMEELLSHIVTKRHLDPRYYELALPPSKPKSMQAQFLPSTVLHTLNITEIHVVKRLKPLTDKKHQASYHKKQKIQSPPDQRIQSQSVDQKSMTLPAAWRRTPQAPTEKQTPMALVRVHLPYDQCTVIQVSPTMTMPQLLVYICEKRNLNPAHHYLVLPSPTSGQMRTVTREMTVSSLQTGVITLVSLKAPLSSNQSSMMPDYNISGKKGSFSPTEVKSAAVETSKKRTAAPLPAIDIKQKAPQHAVYSSEAKVVEKSDKEQPPVKHIAKRKAPPPPIGVKKNVAVSSSQSEPDIAYTKQPLGSPTKRPAPAVPTTAKQHEAGKQMPKQQTPPPSPLKTSPSTTEGITNQQGSPSLSTAKKRRPAPTRPAPHAQRKLESELHDDPMDTTIPDHTSLQLQQKYKKENRPGSATSAQIRLEINELEASLADVVEEAEWCLQQEKTITEDSSTKQDRLPDEIDSGHTPMEVNDSQSSPKADNKIVDTSQPQGLAPGQMLSESGTVRGIKGRVREQIASNQSKMMVQGLMMKKQQTFARTPLAVIHKAGGLDGPQEETNLRISLKRSGSQEEISNKESENVGKRRSNSLRTNQTEKQNDKKQKPRGKAPPPPQNKVKAKQPQSKSLDHQFITAPPEEHNVTIPAEDNQVLQQNTETLTKQMAPNFAPTNKTITTTPDTGKKVPPKVKPKMVQTKSKEAEDKTMAAPKAPFEIIQSKQHPSLSKRTKSESYLKPITKSSPKTDKKPAAVIESSNDGQKVLVLSPSGNKTNKDVSVRIFLPPPPPMLPTCQEQELENNTRHMEDHVTTSNSEHKSTTNNKIGTVESSQSHSDGSVTSDPTDKVEYNEAKLHPQQQQKNDTSHLPGSNNLEVDSEMEAIEQLPHILFHSLEDLPPTPPGSLCNELESAEMKMMESELNNNDDDIDVIPPPPPMDDFNIDYDDGMISPLPLADDFDPLSLPPPLPLDDNDIFDIIPPPPSSSIEDDDIITTTTEVSSQPFEDDETFRDSSAKLSPQQTNDEALEYGSDDENILFNLLPDDVSSSESDAELPATLTKNIMSELESTEPDVVINAVQQVDKDEKHVSQPDVKTKNITAELESIKPELTVNAETKGQKDTVELQQPRDELSNIIASLETMLQNEPQSYKEQVVDDTKTKLPPSAGWVEPSSDQPTEAPVDGSKDDVSKDCGKNDVLKANLNQQSTDDINQTATVIPKVDTAETMKVKPPPAAPFPIRVAPPPPPLPPVGKVKTQPKMVTSSINTTSPTKAKSPPAVKPKPKRPLSGPLVEEFQDELAEKLKRRQQKIHDWAKDDDKPELPPQTAPTILATVPSATKAKTAGLNTAPGMPNLQVTSDSLLQGATSNAQLPIGTQQHMEQIQLLQNQMLQQQILQLQQQLQQLQQQLPQGQATSNPTMMIPQIVLQAETGMQIPQVGIGMQIPQAANLMQTSQFNTGMEIPMQQQSGIPMHNPSLMPNDKRTFNATSTPKITTGLNTSTDSTSDSTYSETPPPLPATSPPPLDHPAMFDQVIRRNLNKSMSDSLLHQRPPSQALRSKAFGEYEDALDNIMEEVREVDHNTVLKKLPPPPNQTRAGCPHTEMASLLAEAMKRRRINITLKRHSSASAEEEPDTSHEWD